MAASEHDHEDVALASEIQAISGTEIHPHFRHLTADWLPVPQVSCFRLPQARRNSNLTPLIGQCNAAMGAVTCRMAPGSASLFPIAELVRWGTT